jgi:hypothetical protein
MESPSTAVAGITFGVLLVAIWLRRSNKIRVAGLVLLALYYLIVIQLMQMAGCFRG